jgi:putative addiction module antidote
MTALKLITIGTSTGAMIPEEMLSRLKAGDGDTLYAIETDEGYLLTAHDPRVEEQLMRGQDFMKEHGDTFRSLAK